MGAAKIVTDATFADEVLLSDKPVLVDFWAEWCGPCRQVAPILDEIASEHGDKLRLVKMNVDENPVTPATYRVTGIPTLNVYVGGEVVKQIVGAKPEAVALLKAKRAQQENAVLWQRDHECHDYYNPDNVPPELAPLTPSKKK